MKSFTISLAIVLAIYCYSGAAFYLETRSDCKDKWSNCPDLTRFCNDPHNAHIGQGCRKSCGVCTVPIADFGSMTVRPCNKCGENPKNTYCAYEAGKLGAKCGTEPWAESLDDIEKDTVVAKHNQLRSGVANGTALPGLAATNMRRLVWDDVLAEGAQLWVNQCIYAHDEDRSNCDGSVGQNAAWNAGSSGLKQFQWVGVTQRWYNEIKDFKDTSLVDKFIAGPDFGKIGHFTQVIWAETTKIGCAAIGYAGSKWARELIHVCNYQPAGNMRGSPIFQTGGDCPSGTTKGADGLCG